MNYLLHRGRFSVNGIWLFVVVLSQSVLADSWSPPKAFDTLSDNGQFSAHVIPAPSTNSRPMLIVSSIQNHRTNELWRTALSNWASPIEVCVWNEGTAVVTLDNWGGVGYGLDVVAIYGPEGQRAKYALEEFAPPPKPTSSSTQGFSPLMGFDGYGGKFTHSTSSRHWRTYSIYFLYRDAGQVLFCLWLDWDSRWVAWRMSDGKLVGGTADQAKRFNIEGRRRVLKLAANDDALSAALNFLGRLRYKQDRPLIEAWLRDNEFFTGSTTAYSSPKSRPTFCYNAYSSKRQEAEHMLACWDGLATNISGMGNSETYRYLGTVKGRITLTIAPKNGDGTLRLCLIPSAVPLEKWSETRPEHYLIADLHGNYPVEFDGQEIKDLPLTRTIDFVFYGVTPGNYRLKAVWNKTPPLAKPEAIVCLPHSGDYESISSPLISVKQGKVLEGVQVQCTRSAGEGRERVP